MAKKMIMCDTNILIRIMRDKNEKVLKQVSLIGEDNPLLWSLE